MRPDHQTAGAGQSAIVGLWLGGCLLLLAVFPPFYLAAGGQRALVLGMPLAIAYWLIDAVLLVAGIALLMRVGACAASSATSWTTNIPERTP